MAQLISITTKPMLYERTAVPARLELSQENPTVSVTRQPAVMEIHQEHPKVQLDSTAYRSSLGFKGIVDFAQSEADRGERAVMQATADYAEVGNMMAKAYKGVSVIDAALSKLSNYAQADLVLVPLNPINISWQPGGVSINYTPVQMDFDWNTPPPQLSFTPGSISMNITQYPSIEIQYLGGPNYVPPSADPNYSA